ncbi:MAG: PAS domain-containing sensor histidine kinase [Planctomycetota bacterium]|jgi:signal transduction histidine kinase|nr:PAS domain-containing sensor histidine kinase [Planctomycetota bacterium]
MSDTEHQCWCDDLPVGLMEVDASGIAQRVNPRCCVTLLRSEHDLQMQPWYDFVVPEQRGGAQERWNRLRSSGIGFHWRCGFLTGKGDSVSVLLQAAPACVGSPVVLTLSDLREVEQDLEHERAATHLAEARMALDQVLTVLGHEMRTPLAGIRAMVEAGRMLLGADGREVIDQILADTVRMSEVVDNLLELSRLQSGEVQWAWQELDLDELLSECCLRHEALAARTQTALQCDKLAAGTIRGDRAALCQLFDNLVANAISHAEASYVKVHARRDGARVLIDVRDNGRGMVPEVVQSLGQAFALNAGLLNEQQIAGTGLGLVLVKEMAAVHGGHVAVRSKLGFGTTFQIVLDATRDGPSPRDRSAVVHEGIESV